MLKFVRKSLGWAWLNTKVKVENFHSQLKSHIKKQLMTSILVDIRIYLPKRYLPRPQVYFIEVNNSILTMLWPAVLLHLVIFLNWSGKQGFPKIVSEYDQEIPQPQPHTTHGTARKSHTTIKDYLKFINQIIIKYYLWYALLQKS